MVSPSCSFEPRQHKSFAVSNSSYTNDITLRRSGIGTSRYCSTI